MLTVGFTAGPESKVQNRGERSNSPSHLPDSLFFKRCSIDRAHYLELILLTIYVNTQKWARNGHFTLEWFEPLKVGECMFCNFNLTISSYKHSIYMCIYYYYSLILYLSPQLHVSLISSQFSPFTYISCLFCFIVICYLFVIVYCLLFTV